MCTTHPHVEIQVLLLGATPRWRKVNGHKGTFYRSTIKSHACKFFSCAAATKWCTQWVLLHRCKIFKSRTLSICRKCFTLLRTSRKNRAVRWIYYWKFKCDTDICTYFSWNPSKDWQAENTKRIVLYLCYSKLKWDSFEKRCMNNNPWWQSKKIAKEQINLQSISDRNFVS